MPNSNKENVLKFVVCIKDKDFGNKLHGEFCANSKEEAISMAQDFYAVELDTLPERISIVSIKQK